MKMIVLKLNTRDLKDRTKAMSIISSFGVESVVANKEGVLTVIGNVDPVIIIAKLRKKWDAEIVSVVPAYEQEESPTVQWARNYDYVYNNYQPIVKNPIPYGYTNQTYLVNPNAYEPSEDSPNCVIS